MNTSPRREGEKTCDMCRRKCLKWATRDACVKRCADACENGRVACNEMTMMK
jgi:hypothetical protein